MVRISEFTEARYVEQVAIDPPIEVGEHVIDSLGRLAAIAASEADADPEAIEQLTAEVDRTATLLYASGGLNAVNRYLTNVTMRRKKHTFYVSKC